MIFGGQKFQMNTESTRDRIQLKLYGDLDVSSACELINLLKNFINGSDQIFNDTNDLNSIHPFEMDVFKKNLSVSGINIKSIIIANEKRFSFKKRRS